MIRKIIHIDEEKCNGCGACAAACHEGAIEMIDGKASLTRDDYCDGFGDCLPNCPVGAITFVEREAAAYDEKAVQENMRTKSELAQWPCQIRLVPVKAPYFEGSDLLIAADCTAYAYKNFHQDFMKGEVTIIGCPKLDQVDYSVKLTEILKENHIKSITLLRMEVPCCKGLEQAAATAVKNSGKINITMQTVILTVDGKMKEI